MSTPEPTSDLNQQLAGLVEQALGGLRQEFQERLEQTREEMEHLIRARLEAEAAAEAAARPAASELDRLRAAVAAIDRGGSQSGILEALLTSAGAFASRTALLLTRRDGVQGWAARGFSHDGNGFDQLRLSYDQGPWARLAAGRSSVCLTGAECAAIFGPSAEPVAAEGLLIPLVLRDRTAAALYADRLADADPLRPTALQLLAFIAAQALETLPFRSRSTTSTLYLEEEDLGPGEGLELWQALWTDEVRADTEPIPAAAVAPEVVEEATELAGSSAVVSDEEPAPRPEEVPDAGSEPSWMLASVPVTAHDETVELTELPELLVSGDLGELAAASEAEPAPVDEIQVAEEGSPWEAEDLGLLVEEPPPAAGGEGEAMAEVAPELVEQEVEPVPVEAVEAGAPVAAPMETVEEDVPAPLLEAVEEETPVTPPMALVAAEVTTETPLAAAPDGAAPEPSDAGPEEAAAEGGDLIARSRLEQALGATAEVGEPEAAAEGGEPEAAAEGGVESAPEQTEEPADEAPGGVEVKAPVDIEGPGLAFTTPRPQTRDADLAQHEDARRLARLLVSEIKLYNEPDVQRGRRERNINRLLQEEIERSRKVYLERVSDGVRATSDYFHEELVRILAGGDPQALGD